jgi:hypothetical protein
VSGDGFAGQAAAAPALLLKKERLAPVAQGLEANLTHQFQVFRDSSSLSSASHTPALNKVTVFYSRLRPRLG